MQVSTVEVEPRSMLPLDLTSDGLSNGCESEAGTGLLFDEQVYAEEIQHLNDKFKLTALNEMESFMSRDTFEALSALVSLVDHQADLQHSHGTHGELDDDENALELAQVEEAPISNPKPLNQLKVHLSMLESDYQRLVDESSLLQHRHDQLVAEQSQSRLHHILHDINEKHDKIINELKWSKVNPSVDKIGSVNEESDQTMSRRNSETTLMTATMLAMEKQSQGEMEWKTEKRLIQLRLDFLTASELKYKAETANLTKELAVQVTKSKQLTESELQYKLVNKHLSEELEAIKSRHNTEQQRLSSFQEKLAQLTESELKCKLSSEQLLKEMQQLKAAHNEKLNQSELKNQQLAEKMQCLTESELKYKLANEQLLKEIDTLKNEHEVNVQQITEEKTQLAQELTTLKSMTERSGDKGSVSESSQLPSLYEAKLDELNKSIKSLYTNESEKLHKSYQSKIEQLTESEVKYKLSNEQLLTSNLQLQKELSSLKEQLQQLAASEMKHKLANEQLLKVMEQSKTSLATLQQRLETLTESELNRKVANEQLAKEIQLLKTTHDTKVAELRQEIQSLNASHRTKSELAAGRAQEKTTKADEDVKVLRGKLSALQETLNQERNAWNTKASKLNDKMLLIVNSTKESQQKIDELTTKSVADLERINTLKAANAEYVSKLNEYKKLQIETDSKLRKLGENKELNESLQQQETRNSELQKKLHAQERLAKQLQSDNHELENKVKSLSVRVKSAEETASLARDEYASAIDAARSDMKAMMNERHSKAQGTINELQGLLQANQKDKQRLVKPLQEENAKLKTKVKQLTQSQGTTKQALTEAEHRLAELTAHQTELANRADETHGREEEVKVQLKEAKLKLAIMAQIKSERDSLKQQLESLQQQFDEQQMEFVSIKLKLAQHISTEEDLQAKVSYLSDAKMQSHSPSRSSWSISGLFGNKESPANTTPTSVGSNMSSDISPAILPKRNKSSGVSKQLFNNNSGQGGASQDTNGKLQHSAAV